MFLSWRSSASGGKKVKNMKENKVVKLFGFSINNVSLAQAASNLVESAVKKQRCCAFFVNAHCINVAENNDDYKHALDSSDMLYGDGSGIRWAARLYDQLFVDNVNGTDLFPILCRDAAKAEVSLAFLGAAPGVAQRCAERMMDSTPGLNVVWAEHGYFDERDTPTLLRSVNESGAAILLVAMGVPRQELWISRYASQLTIPVILGVGALFDFYSGDFRRAPHFLRKLGFEWVYRLMLEPRRLFYRYVVGNPVFVVRALLNRFFNKE